MGRVRRLLDLAAPVLVGAVAAAVLLPRLGQPERIFFDETYYVNDARQFLELGGVENSFAVHPPLGKWLIAAGVSVFGDTPTGWRLPGVIAAILTVVLVVVIGRRLLGSTLAAAGAGLLLALDGLFIAQARIGMLDIHLVLMVVLAADLLLRDREARLADDGLDPPPWWQRGWLLGSGVVLGLAVAVKWSGLLGLGALGLVFLGSELARRLAQPEPDGVLPTDALVARSLSAAANEEPVTAGPTAPDHDANRSADGAAPPGDGDATDTSGSARAAGAATVTVEPGERSTSWSTDPATTPAEAGEAAAPRPTNHSGPDDGTARPDGDVTTAPEDPASTGERPGVVGAALRTAGVALAALTVLPALVYALTWVPWLANYEQTTEFPKHCAPAQDVEPPRDLADFPDCDTSLARRATGLALHHDAMWVFHTTLESDHAYLAPATTWPVLARPVVFYYQTCKGDQAAGVATTDDDGNVVDPEPCEVAEGNASEILALGNPALWWGLLLLVPFLLTRAARGDARAAIPLVLLVAQYVPWLLSPRPSFSFYMAPLVPFAALSASAAVLLMHERLRHVPRERTETSWALASGLLAGVVAFLVGLYLRDEELGAALGAVAAVIGVVAAERLDERLRGGAPAWWHNPGGVVGATIAVMAVGLFAYFVPVWTAAELLEASVRERWWFDSWI